MRKRGKRDPAVSAPSDLDLCVSKKLSAAHENGKQLHSMVPPHKRTLPRCIIIEVGPVGTKYLSH